MKEFLHEKGVTFVERDVAVDERALDELQRIGWLTTPVTVIDGEAIVGFDTAKLEARLGRSG